MEVLWSDREIEISLQRQQELLETDWPPLDLVEVTNNNEVKWQRGLSGDSLELLCKNLRPVKFRCFFIRTARITEGPSSMRPDVVDPTITRTLASFNLLSRPMLSRLAQARSWTRFGAYKSRGWRTHGTKSLISIGTSCDRNVLKTLQILT